MATLLDITAKKEQLFAQQQELVRQLAALQNEERGLQKEARKDAVAQIEQIILANNIPKYEIVEIYARNNLEGRGRKPSRPAQFEVVNPELEKTNKAKEIAEQLNKLCANEQFDEFENVVHKHENILRDILAFANNDAEELIVELLG